MLVCLMIQLCKGDCSRQTVQLKKKISDQASACAQRDDKPSQVARSDPVEAGHVQKSEFVLYS